AEGAVIACTSDGEQTWREKSLPGDSTCLCPFAPSWGEVWGCDDGHVYATFDKLKSDPIDLGEVASGQSITAVWVHEADNTRLWAGADDGGVYYGILDVTAQTATWTHQGDAPEGPVREIRESYGALGELRATAGQGYYLSQDAGASWSSLH